MNEEYTTTMVTTNENDSIPQSVQNSQVLPNCINAITNITLFGIGAICILGIANSNTNNAIPILDKFLNVVDSALQTH